MGLQTQTGLLPPAFSWDLQELVACQWIFWHLLAACLRGCSWVAAILCSWLIVSLLKPGASGKTELAKSLAEWLPPDCTASIAFVEFDVQ